MRFLGIGDSSALGCVYLRLQQAGHEVRVYSRDLAEHGVMTGMLDYVADWQAQLDWILAAGGDGIIVFETAEHGETQDQLRREGFQVIGGSALGDRLENDRVFGQSALAAVGMPTAASHAFDEFDAAIAFIQANPRRYVFKMNGSETSSWRNYVGRAADGGDVVALLRGQRARFERADVRETRFVLMEHLEGVETGLGAYFNGEHFLEPVCLDWEHKRFFPGDLGELTGEMGTLVTYRDSAPLFARSLGRLAPLLRDGGYVGYINLNTIINERGVWPLELTCRFGYPGSAILGALQPDGWGDLFQRIVRGADSFRTDPGYAVGVVLTVPPFPYRYGYSEISRGLPVSFDPSWTERDAAHFHPGEVAREPNGQLVASGTTGYLAVTTGTGPSIEVARHDAYVRAAKVHIPNLRYRNDIGAGFLERDRRRLEDLGHLPAPSR